jgi:hypothetical protein
MSITQLLASILLLLVNFNVNALNTVDTYCNDKAQLGTWKEGIGDKKDISNIVAEFGSEHAALVSYLDQLKIKIPESVVLDGVKVAPISKFTAIKNSTRFQWHITGKNSNLDIIVFFYKGCLSQISLMDSKKRTFYNRTNTLSTQP